MLLIVSATDFYGIPRSGIPMVWIVALAVAIVWLIYIQPQYSHSWLECSPLQTLQNWVLAELATVCECYICQQWAELVCATSLPSTDRLIIYFASAAVTVDSSHITASLSASDSVPLQILLMRMCQQCGSWSCPITWRWLGKTSFVQVSMTWALTCLETVRQRPCVTREIETWLSDSRFSNSSVVDHTSRRPVLSTA